MRADSGGWKNDNCENSRYILCEFTSIITTTPTNYPTLRPSPSPTFTSSISPTFPPSPYTVAQVNYVSTLAGSARGNVNGLGTNSKFSNPIGLDISSDGIYALIGDCSNNQIRKIMISTAIVTTFAGSMLGASGSVNGIGTNILFNGPKKVSISSNRTFALIADTINNQIRKLILSTAGVSLLAGSTTLAAGT